MLYHTIVESRNNSETKVVTTHVQHQSKEKSRQAVLRPTIWGLIEKRCHTDRDDSAGHSRRVTMATRRRHSKDAGSSKGVKASASVVVAVVGDVGVGKTCLLLAYLSGKCPAEYLQGPADWHSEFDHLTRHPVKMEQEGVEVSMTVVDTCGLDEYQKLREKVCSSADAYLVCFDVTSPTSLDRIRDQWLPEIKGYNSEAPFVLVGTKCDMRIKAQIEGKPSSATVSFSQGKALAQELGAKNYCESSAKNNSGLKKVFEEAAQAGLEHAFPGGVDKRTSCVVS